jgi:hypothetical protein
VKLPASDGELYDVCLDPKRMQSLKVRETKAAKADAKTRYKQSLERLRGRLAADVTNEAELSRLIAPLVWSTVQSVSAAVRRQIASEAPPALATVLCEGNLPHSGRTQAFELLSKADYHDLLRAALLILAASKHAAQLEMSSRFQESAALEWYLSRPSMPRAAASAPPDGDTPTAYLIGGVTLDPEDHRCAACGAVVRDAVFTDPLAVWLTISLQGGSVIQKAEDGAMLMPNGAVYCPECAEGLQYCQYCGCTEEAACPGGCSWVAPGVCSVCAGRYEGAAGGAMDAAEAGPDIPDFPALRAEAEENFARLGAMADAAAGEAEDEVLLCMCCKREPRQIGRTLCAECQERYEAEAREDAAR